MKRILILIIGLIGVAYGQYSPTSAKTKFVNGLSIGSKDSTYFTNAGDTVILYIGRDSAVYTKYRGFHRKLAFDGSLSAYKLISDSLFANGYTTRSRTKQLSDSLAAVKLNISDSLSGGYTSWLLTKKKVDSLGLVISTADALKKNIADTFFITGYTTRGRTKQFSDSLAAVKFGGTVTTNTIPLASGTTTLANSAIVQTASGGRILLNGAVDNGVDGLRAAEAIATAATTASTSTTTGALRSAGGLGVAGNANIGGKVGIGEANSGSFDLEVTGSIPARIVSTNTATSAAFGALQIYRRTSTVGNGVGLAFWMHNSAAANVETGYIGTIITTNTAGAERGDLVFYTTNNGSSRQERLRLIGNSGLTYLGGALTTANRLTARSLVLNKDSVPITTANAWVLTVDTTGTPSTNRVNRRNINEFYVGDATFDTTARTLTIPKAGGGSTSIVIPRGTASGASGITALSSSRTGNLVTVSGDNGSSTIFSVRDADSSAALQSLTAGNGLTGSPYNGGSPLTWLVDTSVISTKASVTGTLVGYARTSDIPSLTPYLLKADSLGSGYTTWALTKKKIDSIGALKVNYTDTAAIVANYLRKSDTATMLLPFVQYSDTANIVAGYVRSNRFTDSLTNVQSRIQSKLAIADTAAMLAGYTRLTRFADSLTAVQARIQTKQPLGAYITLADSSTILAGRWLPNRSADSIAVIRALSNTKLNIPDTAAMLTNRLKVSDTLTMLSNYRRKTTLIENSELRNTTISGIALGSSLNNISAGNGLVGTDYNGGTAQSWRVDTSTISTKANVTATLLGYATNANLATKLNKSDSLSGGYTTWLLTKKKVDSLGAVITAANSIKKDISDTLFNNGYTTRARTKQYGDSIAAVKLNISDTLTMLSNRLRISDTTTMLSNRLRISDTLTMLSRYLRRSDTLNMLSPYRRTSTLIQQSEVSGLSTSLAAKLNVSDTNTMLSNYRRSSTLILNSNLANSTISGVALGGNLNNHLNGYGISGTAYNGALNQTWLVDTTAISTKANVTGALVAKLNISDTATMLSGYTRLTRFTDSLTAVQARIQTKQPLGNYITLADSSTILAGRWLPNRSADSISVLRTLINTKGIGNGTVTSIATNNGTGINGGTITSTGTLAIDTVFISTRAWRQKAVDSLNGLINARVRIADTTAMLANRLKISDTLTMLSRYLRKSDTATMLTPFVQYSDTANQMSGYLRKNFALLLQDTATAFNPYLRKSDTATMLTRYLRKTDTASMLLPYLRKTDTISMLSPYYRTATATAALATKLNISDTAAMLTPYLRKSDTSNMLSPYVRIQRFSDSLTNVQSRIQTKLNISDTTSMLSNYRRTSTLIQQSEVNGLTTSLAAKLNISDTSTMLLPYLRKTDTLSMLSPYRRTTTKIINSDLTNSTISGISLGSNLNNLNFGNGMTGAASYNGSASTSIRVDTLTISTKANVTALLTGYTTTAANALKLNISDTATMLSNYARKSGTAFTGGVSGTVLSMSGNITTNGEYGVNPSSGDAIVRMSTASTERAAIKANATKFFIEVGTFGERFSINNSTGLLTHTGAATITDALNATGEITTGSASRAFLRQTVGGDVEVGSKAGGTTAIWSNNTAAVTFGLTQAATFVSSVTATSFIRSGGTSSQFLKADGSVDGNTYATTAQNALKVNISDTSSMLLPYRRTTTKITNSDLANSTISGIALGNTLNNLSAGSGLVGTAYNGSAAQTFRVDTGRVSTQIVTGGTLNKVRDSLANLVIGNTYSPTVSNLTNFSSPSVLRASYTKVGSVVTVYVKVFGVASASGDVEFSLTLPFTADPVSFTLTGSTTNQLRTYYAPVVEGSTATSSTVNALFKADTNENYYVSYTFSYISP